MHDPRDMDPSGMPDAGSVKAKLLAELLEYARSGSASDLKGKYAPQDLTAQPETPKPAIQTMDDEGAVVEKAGVNGPSGSEEIADPMDMLSALDDEAVRRLLGELDDDADLTGGV